MQKKALGALLEKSAILDSHIVSEHAKVQLEQQSEFIRVVPHPSSTPLSSHPHDGWGETRAEFIE